MEGFTKWKGRCFMIKMITSGFYTSIQDLGRQGFLHFGVPYSGVMDKKAAMLANAILGNAVDLPVLELTMTGPKLQFYCNTAICISGADMSPKLNGHPIRGYKMVLVNQGDVLTFGALKRGFRAYLAVWKGFKTEEVMQSYSMYQGITKDFKLKKQFDLEVSTIESELTQPHAAIKVNTAYLDSKHIEVYQGPEFDKLSKSQQDFLFSQEYTISKANNRMAYQLNELLENEITPIITSVVLPGTIQLTPSGKLIILMQDCQTTGGYPRILQLKQTAMHVLAQKYTGQAIQFKLKHL